MSNKNLNSQMFKISNEMLSIMEKIQTMAEENEGLVIPEIEELLSNYNSLNKSLENTVEGYYYADRKYEMQEEYINKRIKELQKVKKTIQISREVLKRYLKLYMETLNKKTIDGENFKVCIQKSPVSVFVKNEKLLDKKYIRVKIEESVDKKKILQDYKETKEVPDGVDIITNKTHIRYKVI